MIVVEPGLFARPAEGIRWACECPHLPFRGEPAWQSQGSDHRTFPSVLSVDAPSQEAPVKKISILGVLAFGATADEFGAIGGVVQIWNGPRILLTTELVNGRHYTDAYESTPLRRSCGDGTGLETMGTIDTPEGSARVDLFSIDLPPESRPSHIVFRDMGTAASFAIFDVFFHYESTPTCPFRGQSGGISLSELGSIVRVGDRLRLNRALDQLCQGIRQTDDMDEARGEALTFIAIVTAGTLETGGSRAMHRVQLDAARALERVSTRDEISNIARRFVETIAGNLAMPAETPSKHLVDRALGFVNRNFARDLTDADVASELGLSTSHFRHLFKEATGQPFHRYLIALRLEHARRMLIEHDIPVSEVAYAVGFSGLAHFSRAFAQRFGASPSTIRRLAPPEVR
ncbi:MAG: AraC family transcriptional regulator [Fimbriimonadales bacterium]